MHENFKLFVNVYSLLLLFNKDTVKSPGSVKTPPALTPKRHPPNSNTVISIQPLRMLGFKRRRIRISIQMRGAEGDAVTPVLRRGAESLDGASRRCGPGRPEPWWWRHEPRHGAIAGAINSVDPTSGCCQGARRHCSRQEAAGPWSGHPEPRAASGASGR